MIDKSVHLSDLAPRLAKARDQQTEIQSKLYSAEQRYKRERFKLERAIAHRELELVRAGGRGNRRLIKDRQYKLNQVVEALKRLDKQHAKQRQKLR